MSKDKKTDEMYDVELEQKIKQEFKDAEQDYNGIDKFMKNIEKNADSLIALGKEAWLKKRKSQHKTKMTDDQQDGTLTEIEMDKELPDDQ